ncbi:MAG TPA: UrcA family protein [Steroidobacteraceae bacterium]|jgi:UrcA family protein|nr:UrcA family protein [Steroidobacteraceae bacterium]
MNTRNTLVTTAVTLIAGLGIAGASIAVAAPAVNELPEVVVEAGPAIKTIVGQAYGTGAPIEKTTMDYHVSYADLDLVKHADVLELNKRVETAAHTACQQLDELNPIERPKLRSCMDDAVRGASQQIREAITSAQARGEFD